MELKKTNHSFYSSGRNFYVGNFNGENFGRYECETWAQFKENWLLENLSIDHDLYHCFRFDIDDQRDENDKEVEGKFSLWLFFVHQRKGIYEPVLIKEITEDDMAEIEQYLKSCWEYFKKQWQEFSNY